MWQVLERVAGWFRTRPLDADRLFRFSSHSTTCSELSLLDMAENIADSRRNLIITFCSSSYFELLKNWLTALGRLGQFPVLVCALDKALADALRVEGVPVVCTPCKIDLSDIRSVRTKTIRDLVAAGFNVTQSDVDAVWLRDPRPLMKSLDADIISSQGSVYPNSCLKCAGHVLCCGFIEFRRAFPPPPPVKKPRLYPWTS